MKTDTHDDRLIPLTRIAFTPLALLTAIFGPLLYFFPGTTAQYWAWEIKPEMSAAWVGAGYTFGALSIWSILIIGRYKKLPVAMVSTWMLSVVLLAATLLHIDRFFVDRPQFWVWFIIYLGLPIALPIAARLNSRKSPPPQADELRLPQVVVTIAVIVGAAEWVLGLIMFFSPATAASFWPWLLTPLMSRVISGWVLFIGSGAMYLGIERRYAAYREFLFTAAIWFTLIFIAGVRHSNNFDFSRPASYIFFALFGLLPPVMFGLLFYFERQYRARLKSETVVSGA